MKILIRVCTVCPDLSVRKLRVNTVVQILNACIIKYTDKTTTDQTAADLVTSFGCITLCSGKLLKFLKKKTVFREIINF